MYMYIQYAPQVTVSMTRVGYSLLMYMYIQCHVYMYTQCHVYMYTQCHVYMYTQCHVSLATII